MMEPLELRSRSQVRSCEIWTALNFNYRPDGRAAVAGLKPEQVQIHTTPWVWLWPPRESCF